MSGVGLTSVGADDALVSAHDELLGAVLADGPIPARVVSLGLSFAFANKGANDEAQRYGRAAIDAGLTRQEAVEALLTALLSRGAAMVSQQLWIAQDAPAGPTEGITAVERTNSDSILAYFAESFGSVPSWLSSLAEASPQTLEGYFRLRSLVLRDGALDRAHKELILVILNAAERYHVGMRVHLDGALAAGAGPDEAYHAARVAIVAGGMVAWLEAADVVASALTGTGIRD